MELKGDIKEYRDHSSKQFMELESMIYGKNSFTEDERRDAKDLLLKILHDSNMNNDTEMAHIVADAILLLIMWVNSPTKETENVIASYNYCDKWYV